MSNARNYEEKTEALILPILERMNFELVDVEYVKEGGIFYLRAYIDKEGGITVNDCEAVAREMNVLLDEKDFIPDSYTFEVSSPSFLLSSSNLGLSTNTPLKDPYWKGDQG